MPLKFKDIHLESSRLMERVQVAKQQTQNTERSTNITPWPLLLGQGSKVNGIDEEDLQKDPDMLELHIIIIPHRLAVERFRVSHISGS